MSDIKALEIEEQALVSFARLSVVIFACNQSERTKAIADEALWRASEARREAARLRRKLERQQAISARKARRVAAALDREVILPVSA